MKTRKHKALKIFLAVLMTLVLVMFASFFVYTSNYYHADETAKSILENGTNIETKDNLIILSPSQKSDTALIFYPGGKVEHTAYLPILQKITDECGITCILVKMPFNLAVFDINASDKIYPQFPEITNWYIGGHSLGGAMASSYASKNQEKLSGLILMGAYIYGGYPDTKALTIYGSLNTAVAEKVDYSENVVVIEGGNHAQFGNYGKQKGDADALIPWETQQNIAVSAIKDFLK